MSDFIPVIDAEHVRAYRLRMAGLSYEGIAVCMKITAGEVQKRVKRVRFALGTVNEEEYGYAAGTERLVRYPAFTQEELGIICCALDCMKGKLDGCGLHGDGARVQEIINRVGATTGDGFSSAEY